MEPVFEALRKFINARPGLDPADYGCAPGQNHGDRKGWWNGWHAMRREMRSITADGTRARKALAEATTYPFNSAIMAEAFRRAFSGRLSWNGHELEYCTGQYYPTEYRKAAATVLEYYNHEVRPKFAPPTGQIFTNSAEIIAAAERAGSHYFEKGTMRFFRSRVLSEVFHGPDGCFFVTSEQFVSSTGSKPRRYTVREFNPVTANIGSFGPFNEMSRERALRIARIASENRKAAEEALGINQCAA